MRTSRFCCHNVVLLEFISLCTPGMPSSYPTYFYGVTQRGYCHKKVLPIEGKARL